MNQYLLICNEDVKKNLQGVLKGVEYLEIKGLNLNSENKYNLLVTPVIPPVTPAIVDPMPCPPPEELTERVDA